MIVIKYVEYVCSKEKFRIVTPPEDGNDANSGSITDRMNNMQQNRNLDIQSFLFNKNFNKKCLKIN